MAYKVIILYQLYMPSYFLGTFTEYPSPMEVSGSAGWNFCTLKAGKWSELYSGCRSTGL